MKARKWSRIKRIEDLGDFVEVRVDYYRAIDKKKLKKQFPEMAKLVPANGAILRIPRSEFLTYWLFESKNPDDPLSSGFKALSKRAKDAIPDLLSDFERAGDDIRALSKRKGTERSLDIPTRLGVAVGLAVANQCIGLTEADWLKIDKTYTDGQEEPRLDYELGATPVGYVAVENKGAIVEDNCKKAPSVSKSKADILKKKKAARKAVGKNSKKCTLVGTIAVADTRDGSKLKCWLLDPPLPFPIELRPDVYRVATRLTFHRRALQMIFPVWRSLHKAIDVRVVKIRKANNWERFNGEMLTKVSGQGFDFKWNADRKPQAQTSSGLTVGIIGRCGRDHLLFVGISKQLVELVADQKLDRLLTLKDQSLSTETVLRWAPASHELRLLKGVNTISRGDNIINVPVTLHQTSSGFSFALIPVKLNAQT